MPPHFDVADQKAEVWLPLAIDPANRRNRGNHYLYLIGRLADESTLASARGELDALLAAWPTSIGSAPGAAGGPHTPDPKNHRLRFDALQAQIVGNARTAVLVLQGAVVFVLLIACANLANLLLARAESRHKEFAVRAALGAGRGQLLRQFMVEGCRCRSPALRWGWVSPCSMRRCWRRIPTACLAATSRSMFACWASPS
jgi:hypothetical protein